jgi:hypothetical protein
MGLKMVDGTLLFHVSDMTLGGEVCKFKVKLSIIKVMKATEKS